MAAGGDFERNVQAYERELPALLAANLEGRFALIHRCEVRTTFSTQNEAMDAGYQLHRDSDFLVKKILHTDLSEQYLDECRG